MPFEPEDITGAVAVWVADDIAQGDGTAVAAWADRISGLSLAQATGSKQPLYRTTGLAGRPAVDFDGSDDLLRYGGQVSVASSGSVFIVHNFDAFEAVLWSANDEASTVRSLLSYLPNSSQKFDIEQNDNGTAGGVAANHTVSVATDYLWEWQSLDTSYELWYNGVRASKITGAGDNGRWFADTSAVDNFVVGAWKTTSESLRYNGRVAAVVVVDGIISDADRNALYEWVQTRYGIDLFGFVLARSLHAATHIVPVADVVTGIAHTLHVSTHIVPALPPSIPTGTLHASTHLVPPKVAVLAQSLHITAHITSAVRIVANSMHITVRPIRPSSPIQARALHIRQWPMSVGTPAYPGGIPSPPPSPSFDYPGGFPVPFVSGRDLEFHLLGRDGHDYGTVIRDRDRMFQHLRNDTGHGQMYVRLDNPLLDEMRRGRILSAHLYGRGPVFDFLIEPGQRNVLNSNEDATQNVGGRGTLAVFDEEVIEPMRSVGTPVESIVVFDYSHPCYDDSAWIAPNVMTVQGNPDNGGLWEGRPSQWLWPAAQWLWSSDGTKITAPVATRWFRHLWNVPGDGGSYIAYNDADNAFELSLLGTPLASGGDLRQLRRTPVDLPGGLAIFGIKANNFPQPPELIGSPNPAGILMALTKIDRDVELSTVFWSTSGNFVMFPDLTPGAFPGVTVGQVLIWLIAQKQTAGGLEHVTYDFTATHDSAGNVWPIYEALTATIGDTMLGAIVKWCQLGYLDVNMVPGTLRLQAFIAGGLEPAATASFTSPNLEDLTFTETSPLVNAYTVRCATGFFYIEDADSVAANGRIHSYLSMSDLAETEARTRAAVRLGITKTTQPAEIALTAVPRPALHPYSAYGVGSLVPTLQEDGVSTADERVVGITVTEEDDELVVVPTLRDRRLDDNDRFQAWLDATANGTAKGTFPGSPVPPASSSEGLNPNENEFIHQGGDLRLASSARHPIKRTGTARIFYAFLAGEINSDPITVECWVNDEFRCTATIPSNYPAATNRRSPFVALDPPLRVVEHTDWWNIVITDGIDGSDVQGHLIVL